MKSVVVGAVLALFVATAQADVLFDTAGFEGYSLGNLPGQFGWTDDTTDAGYGQVQVVSDPTGSGHGNVIALDPPGTAGGWQGVERLFGPSTMPIVTMEWDQYRTGVTDNLWVADRREFDGWWAMQWDSNQQASAYQFEFGVPFLGGQWQHVTYTLYTGIGAATINIDGVEHSAGQGDLEINGICFELEPTDAGGADGPMYIDNLVITQTPEPATGLLGLLGGLLLLRRRS